MNKKGLGTSIFFGIMISVLIWISFGQTLGPIKDATELARDTDNLDCNNASVSTGVKSTCVVVDFMLFGWAGVVIAAVLGAAGGGIFDLATRKIKK